MNEYCKIYIGEALEVLKQLPSESVDCVMTSPPYWALRDYGVEGQLGLESDFNSYINRLCDIFDEVKRVLKPTGTCWVNIGDTYYTKSGSNFENDNLSNKNKMEVSNSTGINKANQCRGLGLLPNKSLCNIPARFSIEMQSRGWILRNEIIWHKPNCMPSSVKDRFTVDFEKIFFFVKSKKYWFETQKENEESICTRKRKTAFRLQNENNNDIIITVGRNKRCVWKITTKPYKEAHFAVFPKELCETPIKAGCPCRGVILDPFMGSGTTGIVALTQNKKFIGIDLNPNYVEIAKKRLKPYLEQQKLDGIE
jgi:DNA modification methylase